MYLANFRNTDRKTHPGFDIITPKDKYLRISGSSMKLMAQNLLKLGASPDKHIRVLSHFPYQGAENALTSIAYDGPISKLANPPKKPVSEKARRMIEGKRLKARLRLQGSP